MKTQQIVQFSKYRISSGSPLSYLGVGLYRNAAKMFLVRDPLKSLGLYNRPRAERIMTRRIGRDGTLKVSPRLVSLMQEHVLRPIGPDQLRQRIEKSAKLVKRPLRPERQRIYRGFAHDVMNTRVSIVLLIDSLKKEFKKNDDKGPDLEILRRMDKIFISFKELDRSDIADFQTIATFYEEIKHGYELAQKLSISSSNKRYILLLKDEIQWIIYYSDDLKCSLEKSSLEYSELRFKDLIDDIFRSLQGNKLYALKKPVLVNKINDDLVFSGNETKLQRIFQNLIQNAIKHGPESVEVKVAAANYVSGKTKFTEIRVVDTGYGIPQDNLESVFKPFSRLPKAIETTEGKGLGLSIVKTLVEGHDGTVWAESEGKYGTTFVIRLPLPA